MYTYTQCSDNI